MRDKEAQDMAQFFVKKMERAANEDEKLFNDGKPAITKMAMLKEVTNQVVS